MEELQEEDFQRKMSIDSLMEHIVINVRGLEEQDYRVKQ
jgi:hypothetical protein